jgi:hypothetical protein
MPTAARSTAFCVPGIWECWRMFLAFAVGQLIMAFTSRLLPNCTIYFGSSHRCSDRLPTSKQTLKKPLYTQFWENLW